ncbi:unnamed protein product [Callosobruchus maculatus]|uniref:TFIIE beta domain-containing protein n=1 Tax=Callosobruchus maculatus TaxID=64391 RepID=A0A653BS58_CALMS|nr:unnamed protein product [Callosobruchus maculatus]
MDPALLKEREAFKKKALSTPSVEKKKVEPKSEHKEEKKKVKSSSSNSAPKLDINSYKTSSGSSQYRFGVLAKIVKHMKTRHQEGETHPLSLEEILDETNQLDVGNKVKQWLQTEALINNPKIEVSAEGKFIFKALYRLKDRKSLLKLLKQQDLKGLGGVLLEDVQESLPHCEKALRILDNQNEIVFITRPIDKKKVLFYNDRTATLPIDEEFQKLWRSVAVDAMDDQKIEEYLDKQGIRSMQDHGPKKPMAPKRKKAASRKKVFKKPRDNEHLADVLETYEDDTLTKKNPCARVKRIVGGDPAEAPPPDDPTVYTNFGGKAARVLGVHDFPHYVFRGIRYAEPPTGKDRFLRPRQKLLEGDVDATDFAPPCIQPHPGTNDVIGSEDCLALNVFTPELPLGSEGLPVVVWIHGGGFRYGSASQYGARHLVGKQLVVVTIQYRLGSLGFLSTGTKHLPGNVALWDMVLAVQWVRNYIGFFGGNPYKINVMGHGMSTGVVAMSGTAVSNWARDNTPKNTAQDVAEQNGCPTTDPVTMVKCLQTLPPDSIIRGDSNIEFQRIRTRGFMSGMSGGLGSAPVIEGYNDGRSLPGLVEADPALDLEKEKNPKVPLLTGICKDETKRAVRGHLKSDIENKLKTIPNFLDNELVSHLRNELPINKITEFHREGRLNKTLDLLPLNFGKYLETTKQSLQASLDKVAEVTADALFSVPAFLTVEKWSRNGAPTFLYTFEHLGKRRKGKAFLKGSFFIGNETSDTGDDDDTVGHGDELAYLFDVNDISGKPMDKDQKWDEEDLKVREYFTQMVADFARHGKPRVDNKDVSPFSTKSNNFIQIKDKPILAENFKFCEVGLWCNLADRLKTSTCSFLDAFNMQLKVVGNAVSGVLNKTGLNIGSVDLLGKVQKQGNGGTPLSVLGQSIPAANGNARNKNKPTVTNLGGILG